MTLKSAPFYWLVCDRCGKRADYGENIAMSHAGDARDIAADSEWLITGHPTDEHHYCESCHVWDEEQDKSVPMPPARTTSEGNE